MTYIVEMVLMGVVATLFMDLLAGRMAKMRIIRPPIGPESVGRWILYMLRGKFIHRNIVETPALNDERLAALLAHYLIGVALAGLYLMLEEIEPTFRQHLWMPLAFGLATVLLPWFWLYPSMGFGCLASKSPKRSPYIITSLVNHTNFGLGLTLWVVFLRPLLI